MKAGRDRGGKRIAARRGNLWAKYIVVWREFANASQGIFVVRFNPLAKVKNSEVYRDFDAFRSWPEATKMICLLRTGRVAQLVRARP
jgi:hypothetical protein